MKTIYKYSLTSYQYMPKDAKVLSVGLQNDQLYLWAMVETNNTPELREFMIVGTGVDVTNDERLSTAKFIGTIHQPPFVWHIFEGQS